MRAIRRSHIEAWVKKMDAAGLAPGTVCTRYNNVRSVFRAAKRDNYLGPIRPTGSTCRASAAPRRRSMPTTAEIGKIMAAADVSFRPLIALCAFAGLRLGEAAAVKIDDVGFLRHTLTVVRQVQRGAARAFDMNALRILLGARRVVLLPGRC